MATLAARLRLRGQGRYQKARTGCIRNDLHILDNLRNGIPHGIPNRACNLHVEGIESQDSHSQRAGRS